MHRFVLLFIGILVWKLSLQAQLTDLNVSWGEPYQVPTRSVITKLFLNDSNSFFAVRKQLKLFGTVEFIEEYKHLIPVNREVLEEQFNKREVVDRTVLKIGKDLWQLTYTTTEERKTVIARYINKETLELQGDEIEIFNIPYVRKLRYSFGSFDFNFSGNRMYTVFVTEYPGDLEEKATIGLQVRDDLFYTAWEKQLALPYTRDQVELNYSDVMNDGTAILMLRVYDEHRVIEERKGANYRYEMMTVDSLGLLSKFVITLGDKHIKTAHFEPSDEGELVCAGFYGEKNGMIEGSFFMRVDLKNGEIIKRTTKEFNINFLQQGETRDRADRISRRMEQGRAVGLNNITFRDFVQKPDGGVVLIGEYYDLNVARGTAIEYSSSSSYHIYKDIVVINIDPNGEILWEKKILKRQITSDDGGLMSGFTLLTGDDKLYFLFNDHKKNLQAQNYKELKTWSRRKRTTALFLVTVDKDGEMTKEIVVLQRKSGFEIVPQSSKQIADHQLILFGYKRKVNCFIKVQIKP